jgi:hypothetical protein
MGAILSLLALSLPELLVSLVKLQAESRSKDCRNDPVHKKSGFDDPVYKKNLQRLIERNRQFEEARNEPRS